MDKVHFKRNKGLQTETIKNLEPTQRNDKRTQSVLEQCYSKCGARIGDGTQKTSSAGTRRMHRKQRNSSHIPLTTHS